MVQTSEGIQELIKQRIVTSINLVPNTGNVYDRIKYSSNWQRLGDDFFYSDPETGRNQVRGWWVTIPTLREDLRLRSFDAYWHTYMYPIHAIMTYSDQGDTEPRFNNMIWSVQAGLIKHGFLGLGPQFPQPDGTWVIDGTVEVSVPTVDVRFYGSVLCHHCEMQLSVGVSVPSFAVYD
jgi:hypothetical protein